MVTLLNRTQSADQLSDISNGVGNPKHPSLYQINTRVLLNDLSSNLRRPATLDDISDGALDRLASGGFDWLWFLGVWQTGLAGQRVSRENALWQAEFRAVLPDIQQDDVCGSCFAITSYAVHSDFGGDAALGRLRNRLHERGMRLLLDFVPNHTALDHVWVQEHPEFYIQSTDEQVLHEPQNYVRINAGPEGASPRGAAPEARVLAYGRDPYFSGWPDTLQLNYAESTLQDAMLEQLQNVAAKCDGVRCDMAMLILPDVFERTWGLRMESFWPKAIQSIRSNWPNFLFMAEVYWDLEWTLQQQGFDYTYDKRLYDRLRDGHTQSVRDHFRADKEFQQKSARFLENHDEPRAAATFPLKMHQAAAVLTYLCPGLRFFHDGQFDGRAKKISVHVSRRPIEPVESDLRDFYTRLLNCVHLAEMRNDEWRLLDCAAAWDGNGTADCFICFAWHKTGSPALVVVVNYAPNRSQCYVQLPFDELGGRTVRAQDLMSSAAYQRNGDELIHRGLYLDMPEWGFHVFKIETL
jgi:hypothetical protein